MKKYIVQWRHLLFRYFEWDSQDEHELLYQLKNWEQDSPNTNWFELYQQLLECSPTKKSHPSLFEADYGVDADFAEKVGRYLWGKLTPDEREELGDKDAKCWFSGEGVDYEGR